MFAVKQIREVFIALKYLQRLHVKRFLLFEYSFYKAAHLKSRQQSDLSEKNLNDSMNLTYNWRIFFENYY
jgi:hypothetical protein